MENGATKPLNILLFSHTFLPKLGGRELVVFYLAKALSELGHRVRVFVPSGVRKSRLKFGVDVHRYPSVIRSGFHGKARRLRELEVASYLLYDLARYGADVIHAHTTYPAGYISTLARRVNSRPAVIITPHGIDIHTVPELNHGMRLNPTLDKRIVYALSQCDATTAISRSIGVSLESAGVAPTKVHAISNGVDIQRFASKQNIDIREYYGLHHDDRIIITIGNYHPRKGQEYAVRALSEVRKTIPKSVLCVVGTGTEQLRPIIREHGLEDKVILTGRLELPIGNDTTEERPKDLLAALLTQGDVYVCSSTDEGAEGMSLSIIEAMAAGLPIIGTDISGNKELIEDGVSGYLVPPKNATALAKGVREVLCNEKTRSEMSKNATHRAEFYTWRSVAEAYVRLYREVDKVDGN